jgi:20S proteasome subunit alpha 4
MWKAGAIGKNADKVIGLLEDGYKDGMSQEECLTLAISSMLQYVEAGSKTMEIAIMLPGQYMQAIPDDKVDELIKNIEDKKKAGDKK